MLKKRFLSKNCNTKISVANFSDPYKLSYYVCLLMQVQFFPAQPIKFLSFMLIVFYIWAVEQGLLALAYY